MCATAPAAVTCYSTVHADIRQEEEVGCRSYPWEVLAAACRHGLLHSAPASLGHQEEAEGCHSYLWAAQAAAHRSSSGVAVP